MEGRAFVGDAKSSLWPGGSGQVVVPCCSSGARSILPLCLHHHAVLLCCGINSSTQSPRGDSCSICTLAVAPAEGRAPAADPSLGGSRFAAPHAGMVERGAWSCWGPQWGSRSSSSSVCTEDVAARCREGTVGTSEEEEDGSGQDGAPLPWQCPWQDVSPGLMRRGSLESLGARISRLSQSGAVTPCPASSGHPAQGRGDASHWGSSSRAKPSVTTVHGGDGDAGHLRRPSGSSASRSRARAMGHCRWQEPPARRGWHGGDVTLTAEKEGDGDGRRRALCECAAGLGMLGLKQGTRRGRRGLVGPGTLLGLGDGGAMWQRGWAAQGQSHLLVGLWCPQPPPCSCRHQSSSGTHQEMQPLGRGAARGVLPRACSQAPVAALEAEGRPVP